MTVTVETRDRKNPEGPHLPIAILDLATIGEGLLEASAFKLIFYRTGMARLSLDGQELLCAAPCALCLNENEHPVLAAGGDGVAICFLPELLNGTLTIDRLRGCPRSLDVAAELDLYWAEAWLDRRRKDALALPLAGLAATRLESWLERLREEIGSQDCRFWKAWGRSYLSEILFVMGQTWHARAGGWEAPVPEPPLPEHPMAHVAAFLQDNYQKSGLTIETLSRHFATNRTSLQARFKAFSGRTPASYLRLHRLSMARGALESTDTTVSEIALSVGFQDLTGFERAFARQYGLAPTAYRRLLRAGLPSV